MGEILDDPGPGHALEMHARLAELDADALDRAHAEALPDQVVEPDTADGDLSPRLARRQADPLDLLRLDERQRLARLRAVREEMPVADEALARQHRHRVARPQLGHARIAAVDCLDHDQLARQRSRLRDRLTAPTAEPRISRATAPPSETATMIGVSFDFAPCVDADATVAVVELSSESCELSLFDSWSTRFPIAYAPSATVPTTRRIRRP